MDFRKAWMDGEIEAGTLCDEIERLQAKLEALRKQEPAGTLHDNGRFVWRGTTPREWHYAGHRWQMYLAAGAHGAIENAAQGLIDDIDCLMAESEGVAGLHLNGDLAPWGELEPGGRFERLTHLDLLRDALASGAHCAPDGWPSYDEVAEKLTEIG